LVLKYQPIVPARTRFVAREWAEAPQRMLHTVLNRMKCKAEEGACEAVANARHVDEKVSPQGGTVAAATPQIGPILSVFLEVAVSPAIRDA
jgi:hypothetical protein